MPTSPTVLAGGSRMRWPETSKGLAARSAPHPGVLSASLPSWRAAASVTAPPGYTESVAEKAEMTPQAQSQCSAGRKQRQPHHPPCPHPGDDRRGLPAQAKPIATPAPVRITPACPRGPVGPSHARSPPVDYGDKLPSRPVVHFFAAVDRSPHPPSSWWAQRRVPKVDTNG